MDPSSNISQSSVLEDISNYETSKPSERVDVSTFLKLIKEHPVLYDVNHPNFNQRKYVRIAWSEMASKTGIFG